MASWHGFSDDEMKVDEALGYPRAYAKLCRDRNRSPYSHGPPFTFTPYPEMATREKELEEMFPIIHLEAKPTTKPKIFEGLLWKQLNHLGNAGFDPAMFRVDPYGNVVYYYADSASPLAWEINHCFPCSRGGLTVAKNLRILQWQVCKRKHHKLDILVPWWDLQLGISINQFASIFAASNSDFRHRAFSLLFLDGTSEELNESQSVDSHSFPHPFLESKDLLGLAPAAIVVTRKDSYDAMKIPDMNKRQRPSVPPIIAATKSKHGVFLKGDDENTDMFTNQYQAIVMARDSLKQREETSKMKTGIQRLDDEVDEPKQRNEDEKTTFQELEMELIKSRRRADKCRRVAEAQSSYRAMLEKMIRTARHQSVVYKEQVRLNQAASNALMARLEAHKAICDSAEKELHKRFKRKEDLEKQIRPEWEQARKRLRMDDTCSSLQEEEDCEESLLFPGINVASSEKTRKERGKGNVDKWLGMLLENTEEEPETGATSEIMRKPNERYPPKEIRTIQFPEHMMSCEHKKEENAEIDGSGYRDRCEKRKSFGGTKEKGVTRSESARAFRPSSPSMILGMRKGVDSKRKKQLVIGDEDSEQENIPTNMFLKSSSNSTKATKISL